MRKAIPAEFDGYAEDYASLLQDPIRDRFAIGPDFFHRRKSILIARYLQRHNFPHAASHWLDVGCGRGELLALAGNLFAHAAGCDLSEGMYSGSPLEIRHQESAAALPYSDSSQDFITAVCVYHHVAETDRLPLTREIFRVLRPGGICCVIEHNPFNPITQLIVRRCKVDTGSRLLTASRVKRYLRLSELCPVACQYFLYLPEKWYRVAGSVEDWLIHLPLGGQYAVFAEKAAA